MLWRDCRKGHQVNTSSAPDSTKCERRLSSMLHNGIRAWRLDHGGYKSACDVLAKLQVQGPKLIPIRRVHFLLAVLIVLYAAKGKAPAWPLSCPALEIPAARANYGLPISCPTIAVTTY